MLGSFMYSAGHCWNGAVNMHLRSPSPEDCPNDKDFLNNFDQRDGQTGPMAQRRYLPVALAECVADILSKRHKVRHCGPLAALEDKSETSEVNQLRQLNPGPDVDNNGTCARENTPALQAFCVL